MTSWTELARTATGAGDEILWRRRGTIHEIRFNGIELMSSLTWESEAVLAEHGLRRHGRGAGRVLIGGLGMGFTLRAVLDRLEADARVTVCELIPAIADWNRGDLGGLAGHPLRDPRVDLRLMDVMDLLAASPGSFDLILMDTDNGPDFTVRADNARLYAPTGLEAVRHALRPGGLAAFWSADISAPFEARLDEAGWQWQREDVRLADGRPGACHHIYFGHRPPAAARA